MFVADIQVQHCSTMGSSVHRAVLEAVCRSFVLFLTCVCGVSLCEHAIACMRKSEDSFMKSVLSFPAYMGSRDQTQVAWLV